TPMRSPTGEVFAHTPSKIPLPALVAAGFVAVLIAGAVIAAIVASLSSTSVAVADAGVRHIIERDAGSVDVAANHDANNDAAHDDAAPDDAKPDDVVTPSVKPSSSSHH